MARAQPHCCHPLGWDSSTVLNQRRTQAALALLLPKGMLVNLESKCHSVTYASETATKAWEDAARGFGIWTPPSCMQVTAQTPSLPSSSSWPVHAAPSGLSPAVTNLFAVYPC